MLGGLMLIAASVAVVLSISALGQNLTPFPNPVSSEHLVESGIYSIVRHPLYTAVIFATFGLGLLSANLLDIGMLAVVYLFVDLKPRREEEWLMEAYSNYADYRSRVKKLIPRIC